MSAIVILALVAFFANGVIAKAVPLDVPSCSSSPDAIINVTQLGGTADEVYVDLYRVENSGETLYWTGKTNAHGIATVSGLTSGKYRAFGDAGDRSAEMYLTVSKGHETSECELKLVSPLKSPFDFRKTVVLKSLGGVVQNSRAAVIPRTKVTLYRDGDKDPHSIISVETDDKGMFGFPKATAGWYRVGFDPPDGSCRLSLRVEVSEKGWAGVKLSLAPLVSVTPGFCDNSSRLEEFMNANAQTH